MGCHRCSPADSRSLWRAAIVEGYTGTGISFCGGPIDLTDVIFFLKVHHFNGSTTIGTLSC